MISWIPFLFLFVLNFDITDNVTTTTTHRHLENHYTVNVKRRVYSRTTSKSLLRFSVAALLKKYVL